METEFVRIEPRLVRDVMKATGISVKAQAVRKAMEEFLKAQKRKGLKRLAGKLRFYTQNELRRMREDD